MMALAATSPVEDVFTSAHLLECIAAFLTPRQRLTFAQVSKPCRLAVDQPRFWHSVVHSVVLHPLRDKKGPCSYKEAAQRGNRLCSVLKRYGRHALRIDLAGCEWMHGTGLEELAR